MEKETLRFYILGLMLLFASLLQFFDSTIFGVVPDFVLIVVVLAALFLRDLWQVLFLLSVATFLLKFSPGAGQDILAFFFVGLALVIGERKLPWHLLVNGIFLTICATTALYAFVDRMTIPSLMFAMELGYNVIALYVFYYALVSFRLFRHR